MSQLVNGGMRTLVISAKDLGELAKPDFCSRCFWLKRHARSLPFQIFPGNPFRQVNDSASQGFSSFLIRELRFWKRIFGFIFRSDRAACIKQIRELGIEGHANRMAQNGQQSIRRS